MVVCWCEPDCSCSTARPPLCFKVLPIVARRSERSSLFCFLMAFSSLRSCHTHIKSSTIPLTCPSILFRSFNSRVMPASSSVQRPCIMFHILEPHAPSALLTDSIRHLLLSIGLKPPIFSIGCPCNVWVTLSWPCPSFTDQLFSISGPWQWYPWVLLLLDRRKWRGIGAIRLCSDKWVVQVKARSWYRKDWLLKGHPRR